MHFIIFDLDGTLAQTYYSDDNSYLKALSQLVEVDVNYPYWKECPHLTDHSVIKYIFQKQLQRDPTEKEIQRMQHLFLEQLKEKHRYEPYFFQEIPGAIQLLNTLQSTPDTLVGVATGGWSSIAKFKLNVLGVPTEGLHLIGSDEHEAKTEFVAHLLERTKVQLQCDFKRVTYVGDSLYDFEAARQLKLDFIGVDFKRTGHFDKLGHEKVVNDFSFVEDFYRYASLHHTAPLHSSK